MNPLAQLLLVTASPLQRFLDKPAITHAFCNTQAIQILMQDDFLSATEFFGSYLKDINSGGDWADSQWKNIDHYFEPQTRRGIWPFGNALDTFSQYFADAIKEARRGNRRKAAFFLGAAAHLVQDLCVPHHARGCMFNGHQEYENWALEHFQEYAADSSGCYLRSRRVSDLLLENACVAAELFDFVDLEKGLPNYDGITKITLPLAQRSTAGLFEHFQRIALASSSHASFAPVRVSAGVA